MKKSTVNLIFYSLTLVSCATEVPTMSPLSNSFQNSNVSTKEISTGLNKSVATNAAVSDLTNTCSQIPKFKNEQINSEIGKLKFNIQNYVYALESNNKSVISKKIDKVKQSYINIQNQRKHLNKLEDEQLNSILVKIKRNIASIEQYYTNPQP